MSAKNRKENWAKKIQVNMKRTYVKFYIGEYAWFMLNSKLNREKISEIKIQPEGKPDMYLINLTWFSEDNVHQTKQALWQSLMNDFIERENIKKGVTNGK